MTIGAKIKEIRLSLKRSLREFDSLTGISYGYLGLLERGNSGHADGKIPSPTLEVVKQICDRAGYDFRTFLEETGYLSPTEQKEKAQPTIVAEPILSENDINMLQKYNQLSDIQQTDMEINYASKIYDIRKSMKLSQRAFAKIVDCSYSYIAKLEKGYLNSTKKELNPSIDILKQICNRAGYDFRIFLEETGYLSPTEQKEKAQPTIVAEPILSDNDINMLQKYNQLSDIQQTAIINLMDTFIQQLRTTIPKKA